MRITIRNVGILGHADIDLKKSNVIIGPQSLGKSTVLKICSYCNWVEKRIQLSQTPEYFETSDHFISRLREFHKMDGYFHKDSFIRYESETMEFQYGFSHGEFEFRWKDTSRWRFLRPKISYIPSERNMVAAIPNWFEVNLPNNNIRNFMADWEVARKSVRDIPILNLDLTYHYDKASNDDLIDMGSEQYIKFTNTSSGLQSLVPMYVFLNYLFDRLDRHDTLNNVTGDFENRELRTRIYDYLIGEKGQSVTAYNRLVSNYLNTDHCNIFLEEPENNLFPPTQDRFITWLLKKVNSNGNNFLFVATHSPYILNSFLERREDCGMFVISREAGGMSYVKSLSEEEMGEIQDYGIDAFFNLQNIVSV